jgi:tetratricopeptide (TPR) repeat protein
MLLVRNSPRAQYKNPDWREQRAEYLYHLLFTRATNLKLAWLSHLLEARHFQEDEVVQIPFRAMTAEFSLAEHPLLRHATRELLQQITPAIVYGWAVLEETPIDYCYNLETFSLTKTDTDKAIQVCLEKPDQFIGLAKFVALLFKSKRCVEGQRRGWLQQAQAQAEKLAQYDDSDFLSYVFLLSLGNNFSEIADYEASIASYDQALSHKPDYHEAWNNRGYALRKLGRYEDAIASYDQALSHKPDYASAFYNKACAYALCNKPTDALTWLAKAIEQEPDEYRPMAREDADFISLRADARFQALL